MLIINRILKSLRSEEVNKGYNQLKSEFKDILVKETKGSFDRELTNSFIETCESIGTVVEVYINKDDKFNIVVDREALKPELELALVFLENILGPDSGNEVTFIEKAFSPESCDFA